jgi:4-amino-4-deoxy-L-arabinose transferase-like glycosyltransferase
VFAGIAAIVGAALLIRLAYIPLALRHDPYLVRDTLFGDAAGYDALAKNLCQGEGLALRDGEPTSLRPPVYPALLAFAYCVAGHSLTLVRVAQALLGAGAVALTYAIGREFFGSRTALLAALVMALNPIAIYFGAWIISETVFLFALLLTFWVAIEASEQPSLPRLATLGLLQGTMALIRPQAVLLWPLVPLWAVRIKGRQSWARAARQMFLVLLVTLLTVLPWTVRNYGLHGAAVLIDTHGGWTLYGSYGDENAGNFVPRYAKEAAGLSEYEQDRLYYQLTWQWIRDHPMRTMRLIPQKVVRLFSPLAAVDREYVLPFSAAIKWGYALFVGLAAAGIVMSLQRWRDASLLYVSMAATVLTTVVFYGCTRFSLPMQPALALFAALPVVRLLCPASRGAV